MVRRPIYERSRRCSGAVLFFFQAEDGIRDLTVTGVQTCALPIYFVRDVLSLGMLLMSHFEGQDVSDKVVYFMSLDNVKFRRPVVPGDQIRFELEMEIGRASCRERV